MEVRYKFLKQSHSEPVCRLHVARHHQRKNAQSFLAVSQAAKKSLTESFPAERR